MAQRLLFNTARFTGEELRDRGIKQAEDSAGPLWKNEALHLFKRFLRESPLNEFLTEDVRAFAYSNGLPHPKSERAWGAVIIAMNRLELVEFVRHGNVKNPKAHATPASVWRRK